MSCPAFMSCPVTKSTASVFAVVFAFLNLLSFALYKALLDLYLYFIQKLLFSDPLSLHIFKLLRSMPMTGHYRSLIPFYEVIKNTISEEIEDDPQTLQNFAYGTYLGLILCLSWNLIAVASLWIKGGVENLSLFLAIAYLVLGIPAAYASWYRTLSLAFREENPSISMLDRFLWFYLIHFGFCVYAAVSPTAQSLAGLLIAINVYSDHNSIGILYFIGFGLFVLEFLLSLYVMASVNLYKRRCEALTFLEMITNHV